MYCSLYRIISTLTELNPYRRIEWSLAADMDSENMVEKYNRLMCEVSELQKDILTQKEQVSLVLFFYLYVCDH